MAKLSLMNLLLSSFIIISLLPSAYSKTKVTNIRLYLQNAFDTSQPLKYRDVFAFTDPLTVGPDPNSTPLGNAQGIVGFTAPDASLDVHLSVVYVFTSGEYNGSTLVAVGRNDARQSSGRQFPIVGGTGAFKLARGVVTGSTYKAERPEIFIYDLEIFQDVDDDESLGIEMKYV